MDMAMEMSLGTDTGKGADRAVAFQKAATRREHGAMHADWNELPRSKCEDMK